MIVNEEYVTDVFYLNLVLCSQGTVNDFSDTKPKFDTKVEVAKGKRVLPLYVYNSTSQDITKVSDLSNPIVHTITHWNLCSNGAIIVKTNLQDAMNGIDKKLKQDDLIYDKTSLVIQGFIGWFLLACFFIMIATAIFY